MAAQDTSTIAYLGEYSSGATAVSLPLINAAGILQVSPGSPYVGLTSSLDAGQDEPERFYPAAAHLRAPAAGRSGAGARAGQADALARREQLYVLDDQDPFEAPLARSSPAKPNGRVSRWWGTTASARRPGTSSRGEVQKIQHSGAQAVFFAGAGRARWRCGGAARRRPEAAAARFERGGQHRSPPRSARRRRART